MDCSIFVPQILHEKTDGCDGVLFATNDNCFVCECGKVEVPFFGKKESFQIVKDLVSMLGK